MASKKRVLVVFVDAFGPSQLERFGDQFGFLKERRPLEGILGYSSGALPTILTGTHPEVHGRMCLFSARQPGAGTLLAPLRWLGLLPRIVHEREAVRRRLATVLARVAGLTGYVALHRVPPKAFEWLDMPERDDLFTARDIGGARTFLADARDAALDVYASPWQLPEAERWRHAHDTLRKKAPDLAFLYAAELDAVLHRTGNRGDEAADVMQRFARNLERAREEMTRDGAELTTIVVGDHGMADIHSAIDPRRVLSKLNDVRVFVDSTMIRLWGDERAVSAAGRVLASAGWPGKLLDEVALRKRAAPVEGHPYGRAFFLLDEGSLFSPSFVGGRVAGMHGYDLGTPSSRAALASDAPIPDSLKSIADIAGVVRERLGLPTGVRTGD